MKLGDDAFLGRRHLLKLRAVYGLTCTKGRAVLGLFTRLAAYAASGAEVPRRSVAGGGAGVEAVAVRLVVDAYKAVATLLRPRQNLLTQGAAQKEDKVDGAVLDGSSFAADGPFAPLKNGAAHQKSAAAGTGRRGAGALSPPHRHHTTSKE